MSLKYIIAGDFGQIIELTFIDVDTNAAADISVYSDTIEMVFTAPNGTETAKTATFKTSGADGIIQYTTESGYLTEGEWRMRGRVQGAGPSTKLTTIEHYFQVLS